MIHPDDAEKVRAAHARGLAGSEPFEVDVRLVGKDGTYRWFLVRHNPLIEQGRVGRWYITATEIESRKQEEERVRSVIDTIPGFVMTASTNGQLFYVNQRLFEYFGVTIEALRGQGWFDFVHPDDRRQDIDKWRRSVAGGAPHENQYRLRRADGVYRWFHVRRQLGPTTDGRPTLWYGLLVDIDDRKNVEEALRQTQTKLSQAAQVATVG